MTLLLSCEQKQKNLSVHKTSVVGTTGGAIMGMLDTENTRITKIGALSAVVGVGLITIPQVYQGNDGDIWSLIAAAVVAGGVYHFTSSYLSELNPFGWNADSKK